MIGRIISAGLTTEPLPRNANGKVMKRQLRETLLQVKL